MDKLEQYLDQVCRSIGGPRALRQHVREELREHLRDAVAEHRAAGMSEPEALERALAEFGGPEQVRAELEAAHGHRLLPVVIEKAMQWKEKTMKARWLWASWAHLTLAVIITLEVLFLIFIAFFIVPKFEKMERVGLIDAEFLLRSGVGWMPNLLHALQVEIDRGMLWLLAAAIPWAIFEWRVRSENKSFMRLSAFGSIAVALMVIVWLTAIATIVPFSLSASKMHSPRAAQERASLPNAAR